MELLDLLLGDLDLLEARRDLLERQESPLLPLRDQPPKLLQLRDRRVIAQQNDALSLTAPSSSCRPVWSPH